MLNVVERLRGRRTDTRPWSLVTLRESNSEVGCWTPDSPSGSSEENRVGGDRDSEHRLLSQKSHCGQGLV